MVEELDTQQVDPVTAVNDVALGQMAKDEDASDFIAERKARDAEERGEQVNGDERSARIRQALAQAQQDTAEAREAAGLNGEQPPDLDGQYWDAEAQWQEEQAAEQEAEQQRQADKDEAKFSARAEILKETNPQTWQQITDAMAMLDAVGLTPEQEAAVKRGLTMGGGWHGLEVAYHFAMPAQNPDGSIVGPAEKAQLIASLSPQEIVQVFRDARIHINAQQQALRQFHAQARRYTKAPPLMRHPTGGAAPPKDIRQLATKENVGDYIKARQAQEKRHG
jgi:hypothetical protein